MNAFEKSAKVTRDLFEVNASTMRKITELSAENFKKYVELNQDYFQKLPEVRAVGAFVELQREYSETLWNGVQEDFKARGAILREAAEETGEVLRDAFTMAQESAAADAVADAAA